MVISCCRILSIVVIWCRSNDKIVIAYKLKKFAVSLRKALEIFMLYH